MKLIRNLSITEIDKIKIEVEKRKNILINLSKNFDIPMDKADRNHIHEFFVKGKSHPRPEKIPELLKVLLNSCFSYAPLRNYLIKIQGSLPTRHDLPKILSEIYNEPQFGNEMNWLPEKISNIAQKVQGVKKFDLTSKEFEPRILSVTINAPKKLSKELKNGLENFYIKIEKICLLGSLNMWNYVKKFSQPIYNVGPNLICDFLKNIGFTRFVKIDHHMKKEFPNLLSISGCKNLGDYQSFELSQILADKIGITPFHLDHLLYQWGRYKKYVS